MHGRVKTAEESVESRCNVLMAVGTGVGFDMGHTHLLEDLEQAWCALPFLNSGFQPGQGAVNAEWEKNKTGWSLT